MDVDECDASSRSDAPSRDSPALGSSSHGYPFSHPPSLGFMDGASYGGGACAAAINGSMCVNTAGSFACVCPAASYLSNLTLEGEVPIGPHGSNGTCIPCGGAFTSLENSTSRAACGCRPESRESRNLCAVPIPIRADPCLVFSFQCSVFSVQCLSISFGFRVSGLGSARVGRRASAVPTPIPKPGNQTSY